MRTEIDIMKKISESQPDNVIHFFEYFEDEANMFLVRVLAPRALVHVCVCVCACVCESAHPFLIFSTCIESCMN
jgi:hypothetical protein